MESVKKNYLYNIVFQFYSILAPFITMPYISRIFGAEILGYYSYANSIAIAFAIFAALGTAAYGAREVAIHRNDREMCSQTFWELTVIRIFTTIICLIGFIAAVVINGQNTSVYLACGIVVLSVAFDFTWFLQAVEDFKTLAVRNFLLKTISLVCIFIFVKEKNDITIYILIQTLSVFIANLLAIPRIGRHLVKIDMTSLNIFAHFRQIFVYFIPVVATSVYTVLDRTMLGVLTRDAVEIGYYEQGYRIISMLITIITSLNVTVGMRTSYLFGQGKEDKIKKYIAKTFQVMCLISLPMIFGLIACARNFVPIFFGEGYDKVAPVIMLFSPIVFVIGISNIISILYLTPYGFRAKTNLAILIGAAVNFVLNLILIPLFKSYGAVAASLIAESIIALLYIGFMREYLTLWDFFKASLRYVGISTVMLFSVYLIGLKWHSTLALLVQISVGVLIYAAGLLLTRDPIIFEELGKIKDRLTARGQK